MTYEATVLSDSPLAYWRLGETDGATMGDSSGNSRSGAYAGGYSLNGTSLLPTVSDNTSVVFSTGKGYVNNTSWADTSSFTIEAWIKPTTLNNYHGIVGRDQADRVFQLRVDSSGKLSFIGFHPGGAGLYVLESAANVIQVDTIYHVVASYDNATTTINLYVNGTVVATKTDAPALNTGTNCQIVVGNLWNFEYFIGSVDEVALYGAALTETQVDAHYVAGTVVSDPPDVPTGLTANSGADGLSVVLEWVAPVDEGAAALTDYTVQYREGIEGAWSTFNDGVSTSTTATVTGLTPATLYSFRVAGVSSEGTGPFTDSVTEETYGVWGPPGTPTVSSRNETSVTIGWTGPLPSIGTPSVTDYVVEFKLTADSEWTVVDDGVHVTPRTATVADLEPRTSYDFRVAAVNSVGVGEYSNVLTVHTDIVASAPVDLTASVVTETTVLLTWDTPVDDGGEEITDYLVEWRVVKGEWATVPRIPSTTCSENVENLAHGTWHEFRVSAVTSVGAGVPSRVKARTVLIGIRPAYAGEGYLSRLNVLAGVSNIAEGAVLNKLAGTNGLGIDEAVRRIQPDVPN